VRDVTGITAVRAWEVLDSRGHPTVRAEVTTPGGSGRFTVPSGASTGRFEAVERRDGRDRYDGLGVADAVSAVNDRLAAAVVGMDVTDQEAIDAALVRADGSENLGTLGANAVLAVSGATLHAASATEGVPLYRHLEERSGGTGSMPTPMVNVVSGGLHAEGGIEVQDVLVIPRNADTYSEALETVWAVRNAVRSLLVDRGHRPLVADEGGFAPPMDAITDAFDLVEAGIESAGFVPGEDVGLALDVAASHFYDGDAGTYHLESLDRSLGREEMIELVDEWTESYPICSVEDPLAEDDWTGWERLSTRLDDSVQLLGDDLLVTSRDRLERAIEREAASAVLVKPNQAGTVTRAVDVVAEATAAGVAPVVSARSGETCDATVADLAVGLDTGQIKIGSLARSERLAKYNRLLEVERTTSYRLHNPFSA
jgi:enolase